MRRLRSAARAAIARVANRMDAPVAVLLYHRVERLGSDPQSLAVDPQRFAAQLERLVARHSVVGFDADWSQCGRPAVAITFDDGYADNLEQALPVLERLGVPATFFVTSGAVESQREFWWDDIERLVLGPGPRPARLEIRTGSAVEAWSSDSREDREALYRALHPLLKSKAAEERERWLGSMREWAGVAEAPRDTHRPLTVEQLRRLSASALATIGAHGVHHLALSRLPATDQRREMVEGRQALERWIGRPVTVASFPFGGRHDFNRDSVRIAREAGFSKNALNVSGCAHRWTDPMCIPRHLVRDWDPDEFERRLEGFFLT